MKRIAFGRQRKTRLVRSIYAANAAKTARPVLVTVNGQAICTATVEPGGIASWDFVVQPLVVSRGDVVKAECSRSVALQMFALE